MSTRPSKESGKNAKRPLLRSGKAAAAEKPYREDQLGKTIARLQGRAEKTRISPILIDTTKAYDESKILDDNIHNVYERCVEAKNRIIDLIANWDAAALSKLAADLENGTLEQRYLGPEPDTVTAAPGGQLYAERPNRKETAPAFIERVYGGAGLLTGAFTRADLRKLDNAAVVGLENWERTNGRAPINLPTLKERIDRELAQPDIERRAKSGLRLHSALKRRSEP